jgi:hypothetical protein
MKRKVKGIKKFGEEEKLAKLIEGKWNRKSNYSFNVL